MIRPIYVTLGRSLSKLHSLHLEGRSSLAPPPPPPPLVALPLPNATGSLWPLLGRLCEKVASETGSNQRQLLVLVISISLSLSRLVVKCIGRSHSSHCAAEVITFQSSAPLGFEEGGAAIAVYGHAEGA